MNQVDDAILEYFDDLEDATNPRIWLPPKALYVNLVIEREAIERSTNTISRRMSGLDEMGLIERMDEDLPYYRLTDNGVAYLSEELDAEEIPNPDAEE